MDVGTGRRPVQKRQPQEEGNSGVLRKPGGVGHRRCPCRGRSHPLVPGRIAAGGVDYSVISSGDFEALNTPLSFTRGVGGISSNLGMRPRTPVAFNLRSICDRAFPVSNQLWLAGLMRLQLHHLCARFQGH